MPPGSNGIVVDVKVFNRHGIEKDERSTAIERSEIESVQEDKSVEEEILERNIKIRIQEMSKNKKLSENFKKFKSQDILASEELEELNLNDLWKLNFDNKKTDDDLKTVSYTHLRAHET